MMSRCSIFAALLSTAVIAATSPPACAAPPARISHLAGATSLSERDRQDIDQYSEHWCQRLDSPEPQEVDRARAKLVDPFKAVRVGQVFRLQYTKAALPELNKVIAGERPQAAVNALYVAAKLGTSAALDAIVRHASIKEQPNFGIRLWAAKAFAIAVEQGTIPPNDINPALRQLAAAAGQETDWLILRRQFEAMAAVHSKVSRDVQVEVLGTIVKQIGEDEAPSDLMQALFPAIKLLFDEYVELRDASQKGVFGTTLAPVLCDVCTVATRHWDDAQRDKQARTTYGGAVHISEQLLRLIDGHARPRQAGPRTRLGPAWRDRDHGLFDTDHAKWRAVLERPPYKKR